jgi:hypothetical protein
MFAVVPCACYRNPGTGLPPVPLFPARPTVSYSRRSQAKGAAVRTGSPSLDSVGCDLEPPSIRRLKCRALIVHPRTAMRR